MGLTRSPSVLNLTIASGNPQKVAEIEADARASPSQCAATACRAGR